MSDCPMTENGGGGEEEEMCEQGGAALDHVGDIFVHFPISVMVR